MGMAASQARFLGLTARKTNVEFQGQQVNQARTVLANESAGLFNEMMALEVPTPPVVNDYYTSKYSFTNSYNNGLTIDSMEPVASGSSDYNVTMSYTASVTHGYQMSDGEKTFKWDSTLGKWVLDGTTYELEDTDESDKTQIEAIKNDLELDPDQTFMKYTDDSTKSTYYVTKPETAGVDHKSFRYYTANKDETKTATGVATFVTEESGRCTSVNFSSIDPADAAITGKNYDLTLEKTYDDAKYQEANLQYDYLKMKYEQELQVINAKSEKIQAEDRALELKLRQLDTEQKALQTEMESVQKVIQKNVEVTFKTFA